MISAVTIRSDTKSQKHNEQIENYRMRSGTNSRSSWMLIFSIRKKFDQTVKWLKISSADLFLSLVFFYCRSFSSVSVRRFAFDYSTSSSLIPMCLSLSLCVFFLFHLSKLMLVLVLLLLLFKRCALIKSNSNWLTKKKTTILISVRTNFNHFTFSIWCVQTLVKCNFVIFLLFFNCKICETSNFFLFELYWLLLLFFV